MLDFLHHLFLPRESNNHKARLLHIQPLSFLILLLLVMNFLTPVIERSYPDILGITADISITDLVNLTNQQRAAAGLSPLTLDTQLSQAAAGKANDMLTKNYWAHNAPDGTTPWVFIKGAGYDYLYAGENLARGFTTATDAVNAWMASSGHRENILSSKYKDVGFAITTGTLTGDETVLIVEMFGDRLGSTASVGSSQTAGTASPAPVAVVSIPLPPTSIPQPTFIAAAQILPSSTPIPTVSPTAFLNVANSQPESLQPVNPVYIASLKREPVINKDLITKNLAFVVISLIIFLFVIDLIIIERRKIVRLVSHSADHIIFLSIVLIAIILYSNGLIL